VVLRTSLEAAGPAGVAARYRFGRKAVLCNGKQRPAARYCEAMSEENVGVVQAATDAFARDGVDGWLEYFTDDVDYRAAEGAIDDRGPIHGKDALRAYAEDWTEIRAG
jgi:hypothetical protein